jgi:hypothetical protein
VIKVSNVIWLGQPRTNTLGFVKRTGTIVGSLLAVAGAIWMLQGLRVAFAPESFMTGQTPWIVYGAAAVAAGFALVRWSRNR